MSSIYKFNPEDAERFAREVGAKTKHKGKELTFLKCPYCKPNDKETFSINLNTGQFECKRNGCKAKGNMITLARDFNFSLGKDTDSYYHTADYAQKSYKKFRDAHRPIETRPKAIEYLQKRGISENTTKLFEITTKKDQENIMVFPFKDENGELTYAKYRNLDFVKGETKGSKEYSESNCKPILFGMNRCEGYEQLVITEGQIDSLSVYEAGIINAVSVPNGCNGFTWIPTCWDFVSKFKDIVVFGDCENGKVTLASEIIKRWPEKVRVARIEDYKGCKDANEILLKYGAATVREVVKNAQHPEDAYIKPLSKVKMVDIMKIPSIKTFMKELDSTLDGGFHLGQLAVLTGKRGQGKSTIASMWGVRALDQNYKSFFYSGELTDFFFKNWMDCQITGKGNHTQSEEDMLAKWYGDKAYIYDNSVVNEGEELPKLLDKIKKAITQYGCQFILIDNLMTAIDDDLSTDLYRAQSKFVGQLANYAKMYDVFILLIAHPRKGAVASSDDIAGSSNITDKADIVMNYGSSNAEGATENDRVLKVMKNRLTGKLREDKNPIKLVYDNTGSRRIADTTKEFFDIEFNWKDEKIYDEISTGFSFEEGEDEPF